MICIVYLYDTIVSRPNSKDIEEGIKGLSIRQDKQLHLFELRDEGEVGYFYGICIEQQKYLKHVKLPQFKVSHPGLTHKLLKEYHLSD